MKTVDEMVLKATPEELRKIQELDLKTQLDGKSFYDTCVSIHKTGLK